MMKKHQIVKRLEKRKIKNDNDELRRMIEEKNLETERLNKEIEKPKAEQEQTEQALQFELNIAKGNKADVKQK